MAKGSTVTEEQCEERVNKLHERINKLVKECGELKSSISNIKGGIAVVALVAIVSVGAIMYHFNYRFNNIEKSIEKLNIYIEKHIENCK